MNSIFRPLLSQRTIALAALASWVFATRLWLILAGGSLVPFWDQWGAEAISLYRPWLDGTLTWSQLFAPHNEHRILLTRLADLALFEAAGGWDPWNQLLLNAILHAATACALVGLFWSFLAPISRAIFIAVLAILFASPAGWQNALWGFQSQVYLGNVLTVGAIAGLCGSLPFAGRWWLGLLAACFALFANAGGLLASVAALVVNAGLLLRYARSPRLMECGGSTPLSTTRLDASPLQQLVGVLFLTAIAVVGLALRADTPHHLSLHVLTVPQFFAVFSRCLAWPHVNKPAWAILLQLPLLWLVLDHVHRRERMGNAARCACALGLFAVLHAAAVAYSRGAGLPDDRPLSRYQDPLLLAVGAQAFAAVVLASRHGLRGRSVLIAWLAALSLGLISLTETDLTLNLPYKRAHDAASLANIRDYTATNDPTVLARTHGLPQPPENPVVIRDLLDEPGLKNVLPAALFAEGIADAARPPWIVQVAPWLVAMAGMTILVVIGAQVRQKAKGVRLGT